MRIIYSAILIVFVTVFSTAQNTKSYEKNYTKKINNTILKIPVDNGDSITVKDLMNLKGLKGLSIVVFEDYKIIWSGVWGVKHDEVPLDINTAFSTASISKPITATLCAILEEKGLIDLKAPVNNYLKRWKLPDNAYTKTTKVTLEHLLSHTAGTTQHGFTDFYEGDEIPEILESVKGEIPSYNNENIKVTFEPGTNWKYSGGGYTIAMMALEDHFNQSLADLAQEHIFTPLNLQHTTMKQPNETGFLKNIAKAHDKNGNIISTGIPITPQVSASGMWSTPSDLAIFLIELQKALNDTGATVISKHVAKRVTDIITLKTIQGWSLGWERRFGYGNLDWFSHGGANTGIGGHIYATMKEGKGMVLLANGPNSIRIPITDQLRDHIIKTHHWKRALDPKNEKEISESLISKLKGRYQDLTYGEVFEIKEMNRKLFIPVFYGGKRNDLIYVGDHSFIIDEVPGKLNFIHDKTIKIEYSRGPKVPSVIMFEKIEGKLPHEIVHENNYEKALVAYQNLKRKIPLCRIIQESTINSFGYQHLKQKNYLTAQIIFRINTELYPDSANAFDSLAEAYMLYGDTINAIKFYKRSLQLNPKNTNAIKMIDKMKKQ